MKKSTKSQFNDVLRLQGSQIGILPVENIPNEKGWARAYALDIGEVIPVLVKAIQELSAEVTALKAA